jgi:predicted MPP superfamily phosphohydrolase
VDLHFPGLSDPLGFFLCLVGFVAQLWLTRKNKYLFWASVVLAVCAFSSYCALAQYWSVSYRRWLRPRTVVWSCALTQIWCISILCIAVAIELRNRIPGFNANRRLFMRASTAAICLTPAAAVSFGILRRKNFTVNELKLKFPNLPRDLRNVRIVQLSDTHLGAFYSEGDLEYVVDAANELRGDLAIMTGDLISSKGDPLDACLRQLSRLKNTSGIWACMGNHEHFAGVEDAAAIRGARLGVNFLRSQNKILKFGDSSLNLVGVDYQSPRWKPYLVNAEELVETGHFNVLLSHNPDVFPVATEKGYDLVLSGHTHGGQVNVEILDKNLNIASFVTPYTKGLYQDAASAIYVNSGIGTIGMPIRLGAPPEITLITLCDS